MHPFRYYQPSSLSEALRILADHGPAARVLAGGTDLIVQMETGRLRPEALVGAGTLPELQGIAGSPAEGLRIGAAVSLREVETHPAVLDGYPALARAAREVGSVQIRNLGTLAGNVCNASPSADTSPALLAYDAIVEIAGPEGPRDVPIEAFWTGPGATVLQPGELVAALRLPPAPPGRRSFYRKLAVRRAMDLAIVGIGATLLPDGAAPREVRIALGAVAPVCLRARAAEAAVERGGAAAVEEAARLAEAAVSPIDDQRASAAYRREMVRVLTENALSRLLAL